VLLPSDRATGASANVSDRGIVATAPVAAVHPDESTSAGGFG